MIHRAKTVGLKRTRPLTKLQRMNTNLNMEELQAEKTHLQSFPRRIVLELTNACNLHCIMCGRQEGCFKTTFMEMATIQKLEPLYKVAEEITLFGWGEPTIHPHFAEILEYLAPFPIHKYVLTNGTLLPKIQAAVFKNHLDILAVSLDGATAATNNRIRAGSDFNQIIHNLQDIVNEREKRTLNYPYINLVFTAMKSNIRELPDLVHLARQMGLDEVKVVYLTAFSETMVSESLWNQQDTMLESFGEAVRLARQLNITLKLPYLQGTDPCGGLFHKPCFVGWRDFFLGSDGYVRPCQSTALKLFHIDDYPTFQEMWNSQELQDFRSRVNHQQSMPEECRRCYQSSHANWNRKTAFIQTGQQFAPEWE